MNISLLKQFYPMGISREGTGGPDPPEKSQKIGVFSITGQDSLRNHKATKPAFNLEPSSAHQPNAIYGRYTSIGGSSRIRDMTEKKPRFINP